MQSYFSFALCLAVLGSGVAAENDVKKGDFPYMAFVYYSDETIMEAGKSFIWNAILIRPQWLLCSTITITVGDISQFQEKTLLARAGATSIDSNYTLNEDEYEQEREIIQIVNPMDVNDATQYGISLLRTLTPFDNTSAVAPVPYNTNKQDYTDKNCFILFYVRPQANASDVRVLMQSRVAMLPQAKETCGDNFKNDTMLCSDNVDDKILSMDPNFCEGNKGGPLVCDDKVVGLQTYINNCDRPLLYQWLAAWNEWMTCGMEEKCLSNECINVCTAIDKEKAVSKVQQLVSVAAASGVDMLVSDNLSSSASDDLSSLISIEEPKTTARLTDAPVTYGTTKETSTEAVPEETIAAHSEETSVNTTTSVVTAQEISHEPERNVNIEAKQLVDPQMSIRNGGQESTLTKLHLMLTVAVAVCM